MVVDGVALDAWHPLYTGEPFSSIVGSTEEETLFYVSMTDDPEHLSNQEDVSGEADDLYTDWIDWVVTDKKPQVKSLVKLIQAFGKPKVTSNNMRVCRPSLSGTARKGGTIFMEPQDLTVRYHCLDKGEAVISVTIPVGIFNDVYFSWTKRCKRDTVKGFMLASGDKREQVIVKYAHQNAHAYNIDVLSHVRPPTGDSPRRNTHGWT